MPMVEIDENELTQFKSLSAAVNGWMGNPESRRKILEAQKIVNPNASIPELDAAKPINDAVTALSKQIDDMRSDIAKEREERDTAKRNGEFQAKWNRGRQQLVDTGYTLEGVEKVEKLMEERGIADHDAGAALFEKLNPPEEPIMPQNSGFDMMTQAFTPGADASAEADRKALLENPDAWLNGAVSKTLKDIRTK